MMSLQKSAIACIGAVIAYLLLWPVPIDPVAWTPPDTIVPDWTSTPTLENAERIAFDRSRGPEDVDVDAQGRIYAGLHNGQILRWPAAGGPAETFADTGGRPLGLHWDANGALLVADAHKGLLSIAADGTIQTLATRCGGRPLVFTDDLDVATDGRIYFSDASVRFPQPQWRLDIIENRPNGRLCVYDPKRNETTELLKDLYFANGVAVDPTQRFVLVNETSRYRIRRYWLRGPKAGENDMFVDNLPGIPDGISTGTGGIFWVAIPSPRKPILDKTASWPTLRKMMARLPQFLQPAPNLSGRVLGIDASGQIQYDLTDPTGKQIKVITSVQERSGQLYLGSLIDTAWARTPAPGSTAFLQKAM